MTNPTVDTILNPQADTSTVNTTTSAKLQAVQFNAQPDSRKTERTHVISGKVIYAESYVAKTNQGEVPGIALTLDNCPYALRVLKGSIKGAGANVGSLLRCEVELTGVMREYNGNTYFNPKDCKVTKQSGLAALATAGVAYAGSLD